MSTPGALTCSWSQTHGPCTQGPAQTCKEHPRSAFLLPPLLESFDFASRAEGRTRVRAQLAPWASGGVGMWLNDDPSVQQGQGQRL